MPLHIEFSGAERDGRRDGWCLRHSQRWREGTGGGRARRGDLVAYRTGKQERGRELVSHRLESIIERR